MDKNGSAVPVGLLIKMLNSGIEARMNAAAASLDLTGTQTHILHYLCAHRGEEITLGTLEAVFRLNHATLSGIIARLEGKGFVGVSASDGDRRRKLLYATDKAFGCDAVMHRCIERYEQALVSGLDEERTDAVRDTLKKMIENIKSMTEEEEC